MAKASQTLYTVRNSKLNHIFDAVEEIVSEYFIPCTQSELLFLINQKLPREERLTLKGLTSHLMHRDNPDTTIGTSQENPLYELVVDMIILYRIQTKKDLIEKYQTSRSHVNLRKYEFLLQHKFKEWNMKDSSVESDPDGKGKVSVTINIVPRADSRPITSEAEMLEIEQEIKDKYAKFLPVPPESENGTI